MEKTSAVLSPERAVDRGASPRLKLLLELEPRHRAFVRNLCDLLLRRTVPRIFTTSRPAPFWNDVFVDSRVPWPAFLESMLWHITLVVAVVWGLSPVWKQNALSPQQRLLHDSSVVYYKPEHPFSAAKSSRPHLPVRPRAAALPKSAALRSRQRAIPVTPQSKPALVTPPDIKQALAKLPNVAPGNSIAPEVPSAALQHSRLGRSGNLPSAVAPAPQLGETEARRLGGPQAFAVAPAPDLEGASARRQASVSGSRVVAPAPTVSGLSASRGNMNIGHSRVVQPAPQLAMTEHHAGPGMSSANVPGAATSVVPPAPTLGRSIVHSGAPGSSISASGEQIVPPPPSIQAAAAAAEPRLGSSGFSSQAVPPAPSMAGARHAGVGRSRAGSLPGAGSQVVPPPPSLANAKGGMGSSGRAAIGLPSGTETSAVRPARSLTGAGNSVARGPGPGSSSGNGSSAVPPAPSLSGMQDGAGSSARESVGAAAVASATAHALPPLVEDANNPGGKQPLPPMDPLPTDTADPPVSEKQPALTPTTVELPPGLVGLVFALPGTSYFSNYEVFVAKRRLPKDQLEFIKLVYQFLPYQRRLSEYGMNTPRVIKLKVVRDGSCDESLGEMLRPYLDKTQPEIQYPEIPEALRKFDQNVKLPCFRTTADDYRDAMERSH